MIQLLVFREFAADIARPQDRGRVITSIINPGWVATDIMREASGFAFKLYLRLGGRLIARTPEQGARTLVHAAYGDEETHGEYLGDCRVARTSAFVRSDEGVRVGKTLWRDLKARLEGISPGVTGVL